MHCLRELTFLSLACLGLLVSGCETDIATDHVGRSQLADTGGALGAADQTRTIIVEGEREAESLRLSRLAEEKARASALNTDYARPRFTGYQDPERPKLDIIYAGFGSFLGDEGSEVALSGIQSRLKAALSGEVAQQNIEAVVTDFFRNLSTRKPGLGLRVPYTGSGRLLGDSWEKAAFASVALTDAVIVERVFERTGTDRFLYLSMPLFLISAQDYQLLYSRPLFLRIKLVDGVSVDNEELLAAVASEIGYFLEESLKDADTLERISEALARGNYKNPYAPIYAVSNDDVTFSENARSEESGFDDLRAISGLLRSAASHYLAESKSVFPPIPEEYSRDLYEEKGASFYGLSVVTDNLTADRLPRTESGLTILPVRRADEDYRVSLNVKTGVKRVADNSSGACQVVLEIEEKLQNGNTLSSRQAVWQSGFASHPSRVNLAGEACLIESLIACAKTLEDGLN